MTLDYKANNNNTNNNNNNNNNKGIFTPLVFSTTVGLGKETTVHVAYKCLAELIAQK